MLAQAFLKRCPLIPRGAGIGKERNKVAGGVIGRRPPHIYAMSDFDYAAPAEVYTCRGRGSSPRPVTYRRFTSGAEAVRFAIEELASDVLFGTVLEVGEQRFDASQIRKLYDNKAYPLQRQEA
jgi:hypothetical protein